MQRNFVDVVNALWQAVRDASALAALLADLRQLHHERAISLSPAVNIWFSPLLYHLLTPDELSTNLPQPCTTASPHDRALATALLRAILLPMRAKTINPDVTLQLLDALGYSLDANHGILAMISGKSKPPVIAFLLFLPIQTSHVIVKSRKHQRIRAWLHSPPLAASWGGSLFSWTVSTVLLLRRRPCNLSECLRLLRTDDKSLLQHIVSGADVCQSLPSNGPAPPPCALCYDAPAAVHPCR